MKKYATLGAILLCVFPVLSHGFEPFNYNDVPFPGTDEDFEFQYMSFVETLTDIAAIEGIPDGNKARLLAAARRISPLNKRAFHLEYKLSIGEKGDPSPIRKEMVESFVQPHLFRLKEVPDIKHYLDFLNAALDFDKPIGSTEKSAENTTETDGPDPFSSEPTDPVVSTNSLGYLSMDGCMKLRSECRLIDGFAFQFAPGNMKSKYFMSGYRESLKFLALSSASGLEGKRVDFLIEDSSTEGNGPAGALSCAVLTKAVADNFLTDSNVAFAGDVNADGTVQPLDDQKDRLLADQDSLYDIIVIPKGDHFATDDILLLKGPGIFLKTQILEVTDLAGAVEIARQNKSGDLEKSIQAFAAVQKVLNQPGGQKFITNAHVRKRLENILSATPHHVSAAQLYRVSRNRLPTHLSLDGSLELIFDALDPVIDDDDGKIDSYGRLEPEALDKLKRHRKQIDPALRKLTDAAFSFESSGRLSNSRSERARVTQKLKEEINDIYRNVKIREKMM